MHSIVKYTGLVAFCCLVLLFSGVSAQDDKSGKAGDAAKTDKTNKADKTDKSNKSVNRISEIDFPDVDGWDKDEIYQYPVKELGYSVNYESEDGGRVTVYVYNAGLKSISDDITDRAVKNEFERAKNDIKAAGKMGAYEDLKEMKNETIMLGGSSGKVNSHYSLYHFKLRGMNVSSEVYLFSFMNHFIKIRATRGRESVGTENKALMRLLTAIGETFSK